VLAVYANKQFMLIKTNCKEFFYLNVLILFETRFLLKRLHFM